MVAKCESTNTQIAESSDVELLNMKHNLAESLSLMENTRNQLMDITELAQAQTLVNEALQQLEAAKRIVAFLRDDAAKVVHGYNSVALELDQSKATVNSLEVLVTKLESRLISNKCDGSRNLANDGNLEQEAYELINQIKSYSRKRESELEIELKRKNNEIEELKASLMDKQIKLQGILDENEKLNLKLEESMSLERENELRKELKRLDECVTRLKAKLMDNETTLQSISKENEILKLEVNKMMTDDDKENEEGVAELEAAKAAERGAKMKLWIMMEEADRSNRKAMRVAEQLEVAQAANSEMEAEVRRLKVQADQWRKAAEEAAIMVSAGNNGKLSQRSMSLDSHYRRRTNKNPPFDEETDSDFQRKKNGNLLKRIGALWKKPQK